MDKFVTSAIVAAIFVLAKILEAKLIKKEDSPIKKVGRDGLLVYIAALVGLYIAELLSSNGGKVGSPGAYTDAPEF
jgi:hypothetical protein